MVSLGLKPEKVFYYFERLCSVPHGSGNTKQISDLCMEMAKELNLECYQDDYNNVVVFKEGSAGSKRCEPIIMQGHMDMVCVKRESSLKDMSKEGLDLETDGQWLWAKDTTLGGDDCIAVAMILAILADDTIQHPPIEAIFTVDEETGMDGAFALDFSKFKGKMMLNLDSEEEGIFTVSCAGGLHTDCFLPGIKTALGNEDCYRILVDGLLGGHSGAEIDKGRANANNTMIRVLYSAMEKFPGIRLNNIHGGKFHNVICPKNEALIAVPAVYSKEFEAFIAEIDKTLKFEYAGCDDGIKVSFEKDEFEDALDVATTSRMLHVLVALPQGVQAMSLDFPGLVQTSLNLGVMSLNKDGLHFTLSIRSSITSQKFAIAQRIRALVELAGGTVSESGLYPGWAYKRDSVLQKYVLDAYKTVTGKEGVISGTHGGLECGLFLEKNPDLDIVSIGPELIDIHSFNEKLSIPSTERLYNQVLEILRLCCEQ